jgi:hypothetical protein
MALVAIPIHQPQPLPRDGTAATCDTRRRAGELMGSFFSADGPYEACAASSPLARDLMAAGRLPRSADGLHAFCVELAGAADDADDIGTALDVSRGGLAAFRLVL